MQILKVKALLFGILWAWLAGVDPTATAAQEMRRLDNVKYLPEGREERMWLRIPAEAGPNKRLPAVLIIPGGGWAAHFSKRYLPIAEKLAGWGYVAVVIDYRIASDQAKGISLLHTLADCFPQCLKDCKTAVRFLRKNAAEYGIDPNHIGALGSSAGGHLAATTAMVQPKDGMEPDDDGLGDVSSGVQACVCYYGAYDFSTSGSSKGKDSPEDIAAGKKGSTINYVDKDDPPIFVIHGTNDQTVPVRQSRKLAEVLKRAGTPYEYWEVEGADHGSCLNGKIKGDEDRVKAFFDTRLKEPTK